MSWKDFFKLPEEKVSSERKEKIDSIAYKQTERKPINIPAESSEVRGTVHIPPRTEFNEYKREPGNYTRYVYREKKDIIIFVIENSAMTKLYKREITSLITKIAQSNDNNFFILLRLCEGKWFSDVLNHGEFTNEVLSNLFVDAMPDNIDYAEVFKHIDEFYKNIALGLEYKDKKYEIQNINILFVGTGNSSKQDGKKSEDIQLLKDLKSKTKIKTIKYLCLEDNQAIEVAKYGFPVIGHMITDFYK